MTVIASSIPLRASDFIFSSQPLRISLTKVLASTTIGTPIEITGQPTVSSSIFCLELPTPEPGTIPLVDICGTIKGAFINKPVVIIGNDTEFDSHGYKLHIVYGALAAPSERAHNTINDTPEAMTMSWELSTTPVKVDGFKPTASVVIDSTKVDAEKLKTLEDKLYGTNGASDPETGTEPTLLMPNEIAAIVKTA